MSDGIELDHQQTPTYPMEGLELLHDCFALPPRKAHRVQVRIDAVPDQDFGTCALASERPAASNGTRTFFFSTEFVDEVEDGAQLQVACIAKRERILHQPNAVAQRKYGVGLRGLARDGLEAFRRIQHAVYYQGRGYISDGVR